MGIEKRLNFCYNLDLEKEKKGKEEEEEEEDNCFP